MKIIKNCLKNLLVNIKYYFVPLGIVMFFIIIGISVGIPVILNSIKTTFNGIAGELGGVTFDWISALNKVIEKVVAIDQSDGLNSVLTTISDKDWVITTLTQVAGALFGDSVSGQEIVGLIRGCAETITVTLFYIFAMAITGFIVSFLVILVAVRKSMTKTGWIKAIVFSVLDTALFALFIWIYMLIKPGSAWVKTLVNIVYVIGIIVFSFFESYVFHGIKKVKVREIVNAKNLVFWIIGNTLVLLIGIGLCVLPVVLVPWYGGIILAIPFIEIVFLVIHINAESYVRDLILTKNKEPKQKQIKKEA